VPIIDPVTGFSVFFPDLTNAAVPAVGEDLQSNLIMPEPTAFLSRKLPVCSIIRPTATKNAATVALQGFINMNVFVGQSKAFFDFVTQLAAEADAVSAEPASHASAALGPISASAVHRAMINLVGPTLRISGAFHFCTCKGSTFYCHPGIFLSPFQFRDMQAGAWCCSRPPQAPALA
jgi:hypothetical protein